MQLPILLLIIASIANSLLGLLVLTRSYRKAYGWFFALCVFGVAAWGIGDALILSATNPALVDFSTKLFYFAPVPIPVFILWFSFAFPADKKVPAWALWGGIASIVAWFTLILTNVDFLMKSITISTEGLNEPITSTAGFLLYSSHFSIFFTLTYGVLLYRYFKSKPGQIRIQTLYSLVAVFMASVPALMTNLSLPIMGNSRLIWLGPIFTVIFVAIEAYAIVKHRLFDIRLVVARSLAYLLSIGILLAIYAIVTELITSYVSDVFEGSLFVDQVLPVLLLAVLVISYGPLKRQFDQLSNAIFYRDSYNAQEFLDELNQVLVSSTDIELLLKRSSEIISKHLKVEYSLFGLRETAYSKQRVIGVSEKEFDEKDIEAVRHLTPRVHSSVIVADNLGLDQEELKKFMQKYGIAVLARLTPAVELEIEGIGYLVLGSKKSGNPFSKDDVKLLEIITNELVIAVQNALRFEEIENFTVTLQEKVDDATKRLKRANEKLKLMDETKDEFISMASHQLRTPLTSVKGYVSMVLEGDAGKLNPMQTKLLEQSFTSSQRMVYLIADLLNLSRLKTGKFVIDAKPTNLSDVIQGEVEQLTETAAGRNLKLVYKKPATFPTLMLDETKIRQVIMNFVDNAIYYTPSGGKVEIKLTENDTSVEFTVHDNGIGVPPSEQPHLFSKFYRAKNAQKARPDGTGLGLFMAKKVIVAQGGATIFTSEVGKGSTFGFTFSKDKLKVQ